MNKKQNKKSTVFTAEQVQALIKQRNVEFKAASAAGKRVLIAEDVLEQLKNNRIKATSGEFVSFDHREGYQLPFDNEDSVQEKIFSREIETCQCCALGSLAVSCVLFNNNVTIENAQDQLCNLGDGIFEERKFTHGLTKYFSRKQLELIENAFEQGEGYFNECDIELVNSSENIEKAIKFGENYENVNNRLKAIMKNIIENKGTFIP